MAGEGGAAVLQVLVQNLIDLSTNEISLIRGLNKEAQKLTPNLLTIQQFLNDAEMHTITGAVKIWLQSLENAAFEADNVLDEFNYQLLSRKLNKGKVLLTCFSFFPHTARKRKMGVSIKEINMNLDSINKTATELGLQKILADAPTAHDAGVETDSFSADPIFIGRDDLLKEIVKTLISSVATHDDERVFSILPIVGMGGLGKTTLTRKLFHHQNMETQFGSRIWVHVSQVFDPINLFNKILEDRKRQEKDESGQQKDESRDTILAELKQALKDKTYLLVLDDVWNDDVSKWEDFLNSLSGVTNTKGNAIIVTTRSMKVASIVGALDIHELKGLPEEDCWKIIRAKTFGKEDVPLDFESIGKEIAKRCDGLPLAASVVGGVLRCDKSVDKWVSIRDDWLPEGEEESENNITKILRLSFDNLSSPSLKKCFAYCSIFPKGYIMKKQKLIEMWMGEGFLGSNDDMESVGDKFYNVLLQVESGSTSEVKVFPNLQSLKISNCNQLMKVPMLGHLPNLKSLYLGGLSNVKSINSSFYGISNETGVVFPVLKTLELSDMDSLKEWAEVESGSTSEVKVFPHLQSLMISNCNRLMKVPFNHFSSCLKSLEISGCNQLTTDSSYSPLMNTYMSKLTSLKNLILEGLQRLPDELFYSNPNLSVLKLSKCPELRELPDGLQTLNSLEKLIIEECPELKRIGCSSVGSFTSLAELKIRECHGLVDFPYEMVESSALWTVALEGLSSLSNLPRVIECLAKSTACLKELRIVGVPKFLATSVDQVWHFPYLKRLVIDVSMEGSRETSVATLDRILQGCSCNRLCKLYLTGMYSWECLPESIQHLTSLFELELNNFGMEELPEWFDQYISSQRFSWFNLKLSECKRLRRLPSTYAMRRLIKKKRVHITGCPKLTTK